MESTALIYWICHCYPLGVCLVLVCYHRSAHMDDASTMLTVRTRNKTGGDKLWIFFAIFCSRLKSCYDLFAIFCTSYSQFNAIRSRALFKGTLVVLGLAVGPSQGYPCDLTRSGLTDFLHCLGLAWVTFFSVRSAWSARVPS